MKKLILETAFFAFWLLLFFLLIFKCLQKCEVVQEDKKEKINVVEKKFTFQQPKDWNEDKVINNKKRATIESIYNYKPND